MRFSEDPALILDDSDYNTPYEPATAEAKSSDNQDDMFHLYDFENPQNGRGSVPCPRIVVKRYIPTKEADIAQTASRITLLLLPGMGLPKEVWLYLCAKAALITYNN